MANEQTTGAEPKSGEPIQGTQPKKAMFPDPSPPAVKPKKERKPRADKGVARGPAGPRKGKKHKKPISSGEIMNEINSIKSSTAAQIATLTEEYIAAIRREMTL